MRSKSEFWRKQKKGPSEDKISSRIVLYKVSTVRPGLTSLQLRVFFIGNPLLFYQISPSPSLTRPQGKDSQTTSCLRLAGWTEEEPERS